MNSIFYTDTGKGLPVVFIHGFCQTHEVWDEFIIPFTKDFRVITIDLPGFGLSPLPDGNFTIDDIGKTIIDWLTGLQISKAVVIGHSLGGYVTLSIAQQQPDLLAGFGLFHSTAFADSEEKKANRHRVISFVRKNGMTRYIDAYIPSLFVQKKSEIQEKIYELGYKTSLNSFNSYSLAMKERADRTDVLRSFLKPVIILAGQKDGIIPLKDLEKQVTFLKNPAFTLLEKSAHMGMMEEKEEAQEAIIKFASKCALAV